MCIIIRSFKYLTYKRYCCCLSVCSGNCRKLSLTRLVGQFYLSPYRNTGSLYQFNERLVQWDSRTDDCQIHLYKIRHVQVSRYDRYFVFLVEIFKDLQLIKFLIGVIQNNMTSKTQYLPRSTDTALSRTKYEHLPILHALHLIKSPTA